MATVTPNVWVAASDGKIDVVLKHLEAGVSPNVLDENGYTPMHAAASYGHKELLKLLVERGGNVNVCDNDGETPLFVCETVPMAQMLVEELNADPLVKNAEGLVAAQVIESNGEFPDVASYLYKATGMQPSNPQMPENTEMKYAKFMTPTEMEGIDAQPLLDENAKQDIQRILELGQSSEETDAQLRKLLENALSGRFGRNVRSREE
ncbi:hypothetical protein SJAG_01812 [Schizosaccharomyces japonicus yFS275]|uniref:Uncharacterized protein n=1 Tax=Schizosaccharomyces japonicus (strain yFS275 / FY16936) TaxID=402676 RepID=B6JYY9_SCHJY|nr:hypothetical protein SJAG_01812 [Schizosaccharomyces japonicus yFS275]EEB06757.1 hypothetical protein SJAG_01812 [Schizosaccharomyces japonicus yFS275]